MSVKCGIGSKFPVVLLSTHSVLILGILKGIMPLSGVRGGLRQGFQRDGVPLAQAHPSTNTIIQHSTRPRHQDMMIFSSDRKKSKINRKKVAFLSFARYIDVITRYYKGENIVMADLDLLAKICCVLNCEIQDLLEYQPAEE